MKSNFLFILLAFFIGFMPPVQGALNSLLNQYLKHPLQATFINFTFGVLVLVVLLLAFNISFPSIQVLKQTPWYLMIGGAMGVIFVSSIIVLIPKIGATNLLAAAIVGQLVMSVIIDHKGWLKVPVHEINIYRVVGVVLLIAGIFLVQKT